VTRKQRRRREYGTGSIYQRGDGLYIGAVDAGTYPNGKRRRIQVSGKTEELVKKRLRDKQRALSLTGDTNVSPRATVKSWALEWLPLQERRLRPNAFNATRSAVNKWIIPTIGNVRFDTLNPAHIRAVTNAQRDADKSSSTQLRTHSVLMSLLRGAQLEGYPITDRLLNVERPEKAINDRAAMTVDEAVAILETAATHPNASRWVAAFLQGMRQAECLGLTWDAIDFTNDDIALSWQLQPLPYKIARDRDSGFRIPDRYEARQVRGRLHLVRPKSKSGWRVIPMVPWMRTSLETWQAIAPETPHGLVWYHPTGTPSKLDDAQWYALQDAAKVKHPSGRHYTIHEARHTTATLLHEAGTEPAIIAAILGQAKLVESYLHLKRSPRVREALQNVAGILNPAGG
jgi:integrase